MADEFLLDYAGPSSFYQVYETISQHNPVLLPRLLRPKSQEKSLSTQSLEVLIKFNHSSNSIMTIGLVKIEIRNDINEYFLESCHILSTIQKVLHEPRFRINLPIDKKNKVSSLYVVVFHLGQEATSPLTVVRNVLSSRKSHGNSYIVELNPYQHIRRRKFQSFPHIAARKEFFPISINKPFRLALQVTTQKSPKGKSKSQKNPIASPTRSCTQENFDVLIKCVTDPQTPISKSVIEQSIPTTKIYYHFMTKNFQSKVERHEEIQCPWCKYPKSSRRCDSQVDESTFKSEIGRLTIQAPLDQYNAIIKWTNLQFFGGKPFIPVSHSPSSNKNSKRKFDSPPPEAEAYQFPASTIWSLPIRNAMKLLFIHLNTFHSHFQYNYFFDRFLNCHIVVSRIYSPCIIHLPNILGQTSIPTTSKRASPTSISSSNSTSNGNSSPISASRDQSQFIFYGGSWRNLLLNDDFQVVLLKSVNQYTSNISHHPRLKNSERTALSMLESGNLLPEELNTGTSSSSLLLENIPNENMNSNTIVSRQYFHSNGFPIESYEDKYDSDVDINTNWEHIQSYDLINEFQDICYLEKQFMILWNTFINTFPVYADRYMGSALEIFAKRYGPYIIKKGLRQVLLLHLMTMWDFSLINFNMILKCLEIVDKYSENEIEERK